MTTTVYGGQTKWRPTCRRWPAATVAPPVRPECRALTQLYLFLPSSISGHRVLTWILREADGERRLFDLLLEQILLVEEQNDGGVGEPLVVADRVKQLQTLLHSILWADERSCPLANSYIGIQTVTHTHTHTSLTYLSIMGKIR